MRLIAISTHTRLRIKEKIVKNYYTEVEALLNIVSSKIRKIHILFESKHAFFRTFDCHRFTKGIMWKFQYINYAPDKADYESV